MVRTPSDLYDSLLAFSGLAETTICSLHKPCMAHPMCLAPSITHVIDFDHIEHQLARGHRSCLPSCDGVALGNKESVFCFIEIKGWEIFVNRNIHDADDITEEEKIVINEQTSSYNLKGKLVNSIKDCEYITGQEDLFPAIPYAFIIVTDINSESNALGDLAANLSILAETASVWVYCDEKMKEVLDAVDVVVKKVYAHCRDFDEIISGISI